MAHLIDPDHAPGILEKNKVSYSGSSRRVQDRSLTFACQDLKTQESFITGPELRRDFNNRSFYGQASGLIKKGSAGHITEEDIWRLDKESTARDLWETFEPIWEEEQKKPK